MLIVTTPTLLPQFEIVEYLECVSSRSIIHLNKKGLVQSLLTPDVNEDQEAIDRFRNHVNAVTQGRANAVASVQQTSTTASFQNGTFLYVTWVGTAVVVREVEK